MWIDSDVLFSPAQFKKLLDHDKDVISGLYLMDGGKAYAAVKNWDEEYFKKNHKFKFLTPEDIRERKGLFEVSYAGMGFMLVKKGVFESVEYPWFCPLQKKIGDMVDFTSEDVGFCLKAQDKGYGIFVDPEVIAGHEKLIVL